MTSSHLTVTLPFVPPLSLSSLDDVGDDDTAGVSTITARGPPDSSTARVASEVGGETQRSTGRKAQRRRKKFRSASEVDAADMEQIQTSGRKPKVSVWILGDTSTQENRVPDCCFYFCPR